jgi:hypothetical protein
MWPHYMILEVSWDNLWTLSFGFSQFHGHGSWLVCEVALSKSQHGGIVPTFEPRETIQTWFIIIQVISLLLVLRVGSSFFLNPTLNTSSKPHMHPKQCCHVDIHVIFWGWIEHTLNSRQSPPETEVFLSMSYFGLRTWDPMWSGESQLQCSQRLRLHKLASNDLGLVAWGPVWTGP